MSDPVGNSLVLVGMPGAGKSTVGVLLAKELAKDFVDTDLLIQVHAGKSLHEIVLEDGYQALRRVEEAVLLDTSFPNHVVATGGSVVYSEPAMKHLKTAGRVVFLDVPLAVLEQRVSNLRTRGIAGPPGQTLAELFEERHELYRRYADIVIDCGHKTPEQAVSQILYDEAMEFADVDA